jgi:hypothetical protein
MVLAELLSDYPSWLRVTRAILRYYWPKVSLCQVGKPMRECLGEAS